MTPLQVFIAYAKIRGIIPYIHKMAIDNTRTFYGFDHTTGQYKKMYASFKNILDNHFSNHGFGNTMFVNILYQYPDGDTMLRKPNVDKAHKRWSTFVNNNVILDGNIKVGSKVKYKWWNREYTGTVNYINKDVSRIKIYRDINEYDRPICDNVHPGCILEVDGQPVEFSFHIRWKGKEYGIK